MAVVKSTRNANKRLQRIVAGVCIACGARPPDAGLKMCGVCRGRAKERYRADRSTPEGAAKWRDYQREYARKRYEVPERRRDRKAARLLRRAKYKAAIDAIKTERGCGRCGWNGPPVALDFDHDRGEKMMNVSRALSTIRSPEFIRAEVARCSVACANCHRILTDARRPKRLVHTAYSRCMARRKAVVDAIKLEAGCSDCGYRDHASALEFDHVRGVKCFNVSRCLFKAITVIMAEIAKCDVYCARCHRIRTHETKLSGHRKAVDVGWLVGGAWYTAGTPAGGRP